MLSSTIRFKVMCIHAVLVCLEQKRFASKVWKVFLTYRVVGSRTETTQLVVAVVAKL